MFFTHAKGVQWYDRGDIDVIDYTVATLTADGAWHDLDVSGVVGIGRHLILIQSYLQDNAGGNTLRIRTKGNTNEVNVGTCGTQVANKTCDRNVFVHTNVNGVIEYNIESATWTTIDLIIRGWFQ